MTTSYRTASLLAVVLIFAATAQAADKSFATVVKNYDATHNHFTASFDPPKAKPGETVTFRLTFELSEGFHTYPTRQPNPNAEPFVTSIGFPPAGEVIFVGELKEPKGTIKNEPTIGKLIWLEGKVIWERTAVVSPKAKPGMVSVKLKRFAPQVCDHDNCLLTPRGIVVEAPLEILDSPAVDVDAAYRSEVEKAGS